MLLWSPWRRPPGTQSSEPGVWLWGVQTERLSHNCRSGNSLILPENAELSALRLLRKARRAMTDHVGANKVPQSSRCNPQYVYISHPAIKKNKSLLLVWARMYKLKSAQRKWITSGLKVRSHQKRNNFFAWPKPMKSQRTDACGCDSCNIFPGGAFGATRCGRRVYSGAFSAAQFSPRVEIFQLWGGHLATRAVPLS